MPKCRNCKKAYTKTGNSLQNWCSPQCGYELAEKKRIEKDKKKHSKRKQEFYNNDRKTRTKAAVLACNEYIRFRDRLESCISCGTRGDVQYCAGHFKSAGGNPELRFNEWNIHKQCNQYCNMRLSGNIAGYRPALIEKIGLEHVEWLEGPHEAQKLTCEELKEIEKYYKEKLKLLLSGNVS